MNQLNIAKTTLKRIKLNSAYGDSFKQLELEYLFLSNNYDLLTQIYNSTIDELLKSEESRLQYCINNSKNNVEIANKMGVAERTIYRLRKKYNI